MSVSEGQPATRCDGNECDVTDGDYHSPDCSFREGQPALTETLERVRVELESALNKFPPFNSPHEGYAVIAEELDELWAEVKGDGRSPAAIDEAVQVAAMAVRYVVDISQQFDPRRGGPHNSSRLDEKWDGS